MQPDADNPYKSVSLEGTSNPLLLIDFVAVGVWLAIPLVVAFGRRYFQPMFLDFGIELPFGTQLILQPYASVLLAIVSLAVATTVLKCSGCDKGHVVTLVALVAGVAVVFCCLVAFLLPFVGGIKNLT